nr:hypothetical protein [Novosphingobium lentum]
MLGGGAARAQDAQSLASAEEKVNQLIIYGNDPCPASADGGITVCARKAEAERFRIPAPLRDDPNKAANMAWTERVKTYETAGAFGINSCSPIGANGATGCMAKLIKNAYAEKANGTDVHFGKLIDDERQKRLSTIDADTAAEQARVESLEKAYDAKVAKEKAAAAGEPAADAVPPKY